MDILPNALVPDAGDLAGIERDLRFCPATTESPAYLTREQLDGSADKEIKFSIGERKFEFIGDKYLVTWIIPNFYFHITTAYNILRHNGVEIGKSNYLG